MRFGIVVVFAVAVAVASAGLVSMRQTPQPQTPSPRPKTVFEIADSDDGFHICSVRHKNISAIFDRALPHLKPCEAPPNETISLLCYAYLDVVLNLCHENSKWINRSTDRDVPCPLRLKTTEYQQVAKEIERLQPTLENNATCYEICSGVVAKPLCKMIAAANEPQVKPAAAVAPPPMNSYPYGVHLERAPPPQPPPIPETNSSIKSSDTELKNELDNRNIPKGTRDEQPVNINNGEKLIDEKPNTPIDNHEDTLAKNDRIEIHKHDSSTSIPKPKVEVNIESSHRDEEQIDYHKIGDADDNQFDNIEKSKPTDQKNFNEGDLSEDDPDMQDEIEHRAENSFSKGSEKNIGNQNEAVGYTWQTTNIKDAEDSYFFTYFLAISCIVVLIYATYHHKNKIMGLVIEGRRSKNMTRRRGGAMYRKLDCNLEEAVTSTPPSYNPQIVY